MNSIMLKKLSKYRLNQKCQYSLHFAKCNHFEDSMAGRVNKIGLKGNGITDYITIGNDNNPELTDRGTQFVLNVS